MLSSRIKGGDSEVGAQAQVNLISLKFENHCANHSLLPTPKALVLKETLFILVKTALDHVCYQCMSSLASSGFSH